MEKKPISLFFYLYFLFILCQITYSFLGSHTAFEWTTIQDIPYILRLIDPHFLPYDFYTNSVIGSPRFLFGYTIYGLTKLGLGWYTALYSVKYICISIIPLLSFLLFKRIFDYWKPDKLPISIDIIVTFCLMIGLVLPLALLQGRAIPSGPFGWGAIHNFQFLSPMMLSFVMGLLYNYCMFIKGKKRYCITFFLTASFLYHPAVGLFHFIFAFLFWIPLSFTKNTMQWVLIDILLGVLLPITVLLLLFQKETMLTASEFIYHYIEIRHPHHYDMTEAIGKKTILWIGLFCIPLYMAYRCQEKRVFFFCSAVFISFLGMPLLQYVGTDIWKIKKIAELGPSRFTAYASLLWAISMMLSVASYVQFSHRFAFPKMISILSIIDTKLKEYRRFFLLFALIIAGGIFWKTAFSPLEKDPDLQKIVHWIEKHTHKRSVFFVKGMDSFLIRAYANRSIFADTSFPFNEKHIQNFSLRYKIFMKSDQFTESDYACLASLYKIHYLLVPQSKKRDFQQKALYESSQWLIYNIQDFSLSSNCSLGRLVDV